MTGVNPRWCGWCGDEFTPIEPTLSEDEPVFCSADHEGFASQVEDEIAYSEARYGSAPVWP